MLKLLVQVGVSEPGQLALAELVGRLRIGTNSRWKLLNCPKNILAGIGPHNPAEYSRDSDIQMHQLQS
jgi:hypothetical protein